MVRDRSATRHARLASRENPLLRAFLLGCGAAALVAGTLALVLAPPPRDVVPVWLQTTIVPATILFLLVVDPAGRPRLLALTVGLLWFEALLTASLYTIGVSFAILIPLIGVGIVQPYLRGAATLAVYVGAGVVSTVAVAVFALGVPTNPLNEPALAVVGFGLLAAFALGLVWRAGERWIEAVDAADREIAARIAAEGERARTARLLETLISSSPLATVAVDADGRVDLWNPAASALFGWDAQEVRGRPAPIELATLDDPETAYDGIERALSGEVIRGDRVRSRTRDGAERLVEVHAAVRHDERGQRLGAIVHLSDVTDRAALESQLRQAQKMEAVGHLAGGVAHDINNTLTAVGGFAELIEAASEEPGIREDARTISGAVLRARDLTSQLLAFARRSVLQPRVIDVTTFVASIEPMLRRLLDADIRLVIRHGVVGGHLRVDPGQLQHALLNLVINARDAMPGGGTLTIATRREPPGGSPGGEGNCIVVSVSDTGAGIPAELQGHVFEPFFTTKERGKGTGLGLAMVYGFVTQSGGTVELRSASGEGATFEIRLPEAKEEPDAPASTAASSKASPASLRGTERILLVEDDRMVAGVARQFLESLGYRVLVAQDGRSAIEIAAASREPIDLVLTDVVMPGMQGPEVASAIRALHPATGVLFASGYTADAISERGMLVEGVDLIEKPYTSTELGTRVRKALDARAPDLSPS